MRTPALPFLAFLAGAAQSTPRRCCNAGVVAPLRHLPACRCFTPPCLGHLIAEEEPAPSNQQPAPAQQAAARRAAKAGQAAGPAAAAAKPAAAASRAEEAPPKDGTDDDDDGPPPLESDPEAGEDDSPGEVVAKPRGRAGAVEASGMRLTRSSAVC